MPATSAPNQATAVETYRDFYEYEAGVYRIDAEHEAAFRHRRDLVGRLLPRGCAGPVFDAGCGDGALARHLAATTGGRVAGMDLAWPRVQRAAQGVRARAGLAVVQASIYSIPVANRSFPLVVCTDLLEHLDDPEAAFRELCRISSDAVLVTVPYCIEIEKTLCPHCGKDYFLYGHQHSFGRDGIERLARSAGARVERFEHWIPMFECRRYKWLPFLKWLIWDHFKNTGTLGALVRV